LCFDPLILLAYSGLALWQAAAKPTTERRTIQQVLDRAVKNVEQEFVPAAEAMPEDKYAFAPSSGEFKGVRTFAQQVKHVAASNDEFGAAILGEKPPTEVGKDENGPDSVKSKAEIVKYLNDSFAYVHKAVATIDDKNVVEPMKSPFGEGTVTRLVRHFAIAGGELANVGGVDEIQQKPCALVDPRTFS